MESLKNLLKNIFEAVYDKIKDSSFYNTLLEKYDNLELPVQKGIKYTAAAAGILAAVSLPLSILNNSLNATKEFKEKKQLIYDLIKNESSQFVVQGLSSSQFEQQISMIIDRLSLSPNHKAKISSYYFSKKLLPPALRSLSYSGKQIQISGVNMEEVIDIARMLNSIDSSVKLVHIKIIELKDQNNYFSVSYSLLHFHEPRPKTSITSRRQPV